ncbi:MAG: tRNA (adenosine(37)-N6)-threonylcarbamoyltransferase complex dimerization subunit type 1 TsaB [Thermodesulfobacteriota bacterium]|nr:MAG: tRNA (adenosine(37)-N6)-threonylcarbamoyltransferase complex dimerization subunit type 1 TsaB [Thermodesulfobacteriota bacterium]
MDLKGEEEKILAIDASTRSGSVALFYGPAFIAETTVADVGTHADWLMKAVASLLEDTATPVKEINLFAYTQGPGSFTGLRVGVSTIKGLAWAAQRPVAGVSTLETLAYNARYSPYPLCPVLDARKGEVYTALYRFSGESAETLVPDSALTPEALIKVLRDGGYADGPVVFLGSGLDVYSDLIKDNLSNAVFAPAHLWHVRASNIALIARHKGLAGLSPGEAKPFYLRKSEAEIKRKKALSGA